MIASFLTKNDAARNSGRFKVCQPEPGTWLWRSPHGRIHLVNATGTHRLGNTPFAQAIWHAATDPPQERPADADLTGSGR
jgi:hypothetical protein